MVRTPRFRSSASRSVRKNAPQVDLVILISPGSRETRSEVGEASGQDFRQGRWLVDLPLGPVKRRLDVHQHDRRPRGAKLFRQRLSPRDEFVG